MKIILAPSKKQLLVTIKEHTLQTSEKTKHLMSLLSVKNRLELSKLMKIKGELLDRVYEDIHDFGKNNAPCIEVYQGVVYSELDLKSYTPDQMAYMNDHLRIVSALYGLLTPQTPISPYRLDMTMKLDQINLYDYWKDEIIKQLCEDTQIVSLASQEFEKLLSPIQNQVTRIAFKIEVEKGTYKSPSYTIKKLRGQLANYMIVNQLTDLKALKNFESEGFRFSSELSTEKELVFLK